MPASKSGRVTLPDVYENLRIGMVLHHPDTCEILDINGRLESIYGYPTKEIRGLAVDDFSANTHSYPQAEARQRIQAAAAGAPQHFEWRVKRSNGELIWVDVHLSRLQIEGQPYVIGEIRDITDHKTNDRRLSLFYRLLRHNIRNDVNVISGNADLIRTDPDISELVSIAERIQKTANGLERIAESVKQIEDTITGEDETGCIKRVSEIVGDVANEYGAKYPSASVTVTERTELWVDTDQELRSALDHAIENSIVHTDHSDPEVAVRIDESPNTGRVEIRISDTAPTIPENELDAIDDHSETSSTNHGSGVGLFVMKWCIESLGGEMKVEENSPRGNHVYFLLPPKDQPVTDGPVWDA